MANFAVIGAGNGGCSMTVHLIRNGHHVNLFNIDEPRFRAMCDRGGIDYRGVLGSGTVTPDYMGSDLQKATANADFWVIVVPRNTHAYYAQLLQPYLHPHLEVAIIPGSGTSLLFRKQWRQQHPGLSLPLMETCTLVYSTRLEGPALVNIYQVRSAIGAVCLANYADSRLWEILDGIFHFRRMKSVIHSILSNMNPILHPAGMLMNAGWIENNCDCRYYLDAASPAVCRVMESADAERRAIAAAYGLPHPSLVEQFYDAKYTDEAGLASGTIYGALQHSLPNSTIKCPVSLRDRYLVEDVSYGLVPFSALARKAQVPTPTIDSLIHLACLVSEEDYLRTGLNLEKMGLSDLDAEQISSFGSGNIPG